MQAADAVDTGSPMVQAHRAVPAAAETVNSGQGVLELQALSGWTVVGNKGRARASGEPARVLQLPRGASAQHATVLTVKHPHSRYFLTDGDCLFFW